MKIKLDFLMRNSVPLLRAFLIALVVLVTTQTAWADFPQIVGYAISGHYSRVNNHTVSLPSGIEAGDLLLVFYADEGRNTTATFPEGWTVLYNRYYYSPHYTNNPDRFIRGAVLYRIADGTEGATITISTGEGEPNRERSVHNTYRIKKGTYMGVPEASSPVIFSGRYADPPNLTPSWGIMPTLWIAVVHAGGLVWDGGGYIGPSIAFGYRVPWGSGWHQHLTAIRSPLQVNYWWEDAMLMIGVEESVVGSEDPGIFAFGRRNELNPNTGWIDWISRNFIANTIAIRGCIQPVINNPGPKFACNSYVLPHITGTDLVNPRYFNNSQANGGVEITGPITRTQTVWIYDEYGNDPNCSDEVSFEVTVHNPILENRTEDLYYCDASNALELAIAAANPGDEIWVRSLTPPATYRTLNDTKGLDWNFGTSPACIPVTGNATFIPASLFNVNLNGSTVCTQYDQLQVSGTLDLGGAQLILALGFAPTIGQTFTIATSGTLVGQFSQGGSIFGVFGNNPYRFLISYIGNQVVLTATQLQDVFPLPPVHVEILAGTSQAYIDLQFALWIRKFNEIGNESGRNVVVTYNYPNLNPEYINPTDPATYSTPSYTGGIVRASGSVTAVGIDPILFNQYFRVHGAPAVIVPLAGAATVECPVDAVAPLPPCDL